MAKKFSYNRLCLWMTTKKGSAYLIAQPNVFFAWKWITKKDANEIDNLMWLIFKCIKSERQVDQQVATGSCLQSNHHYRCTTTVQASK